MLRTRKKRVLIQGGAGGLGSYAIQYCKNVLGMYVVTTCSKDNEGFVKKLGADECIDYKNNPLFLKNDVRVRGMDVGE